MLYCCCTAHGNWFTKVKPSGYRFVKKVLEFDIHEYYSEIFEIHPFNDKSLAKLKKILDRIPLLSKDPKSLEYSEVDSLNTAFLFSRRKYCFSQEVFDNLFLRLQEHLFQARTRPPFSIKSIGGVIKAKSCEDFRNPDDLWEMKGAELETLPQRYVGPYLQPELKAELRSKGMKLRDRVEDELDSLFTDKHLQVCRTIFQLGVTKASEDVLKELLWEEDHPLTFESPAKVIDSWKRLGFIE